MQAGDRLSFIQPFKPSELRQEIPADRSDEENLSAFLAMHAHFMSAFPENRNEFETFDASGFVKVTESSFKLDMSDTSYLHIVFFKHEDEEGILDMGISLNEHLNDGIYNGGYMYLLDPDGLCRSTSLPDTPNDTNPADDGIAGMHFMPSDLYTFRDELVKMKTSDDVEEREHALSTSVMIEQEMTFDEMLFEEGYDNQAPHSGELHKVKELVASARPFPQHLPN
jgi:hypothetical protein